MVNTFTRRVLAGATALTLGLGLVACGDSNETADTAKTTVTPTTEVETEVTTPETTETTAAEAETVEFETADGNTVIIPAELANELETADTGWGWGKPETVSEKENGFLAYYDNGNHIAYSEETGAQPIVGAIGASWIEDGGLDNPVGLPLAPEAEVENGWTQKFANGTISWTHDGDGTFSSNIEMN